MDWYKIRGQIGDDCIKTLSDAGAVKVGNKNFQILIPNGHGDGITRVGVVKPGQVSCEELNYFSVIEGQDINIYDYDCTDGEACERISGRYSIYYGEGFVVFEKR